MEFVPLSDQPQTSSKSELGLLTDGLLLLLIASILWRHGLGLASLLVPLLAAIRLLTGATVNLFALVLWFGLALCSFSVEPPHQADSNAQELYYCGGERSH